MTCRFGSRDLGPWIAAPSDRNDETLSVSIAFA
jgi:hypothetical protein